MKSFFLALLFITPILVQAEIRLPEDTGTGKELPVDKILVIVNDDVILKSELDTYVKTLKVRLKKSGTPMPPDKVIRKRVLERIITNRLQLQLAARTGIRISDEQLNRTIRSIARRNKMTLASFRKQMKAQGYSFEVFRENIRQEMIIASLQQRLINSRISVSKQEVDHFLSSQKNFGQRRTNFRIAHILIALPEAASASDIRKARAKAAGIHKKLAAGADFSRMAISVSDGQRSLEGGDLGWMRPGQIPLLFAGALRYMQAGDISKVLRSPSGFHIIKLTAVKGTTKHAVRQTLVRHILIRTDAVTTDATAKARLNELRDRVMAGEDFATLARSHSQDTLSAQKGGDLGWVNPGQLVAPFEKAMNSLKKNAVSMPVRSRFGWHILQVQDRRVQDDTEQFKRNYAANILRERKRRETLEIWLRKLRSNSFVEYKND